MKPFKFFMRRKPYWLDLPKFGEQITQDSRLSGVSPLSYNPDFTMKRRLIYWSPSNNRHFYGPWINEDNKYFNTLPEITNPILE